MASTSAETSTLQTHYFGQPAGRGPGTAAATRRELLVAAEAVLEASGDGGRLEDVAAAAGVAKSALFRHWASKDELVGEVRLRSAERHRGWVEHTCAVSDDPYDGVVTATVGFFAPRRNALFDPLVTRGALAEPAPELEALAAPITERVGAVEGASAPQPLRLLLEAMVLGTTRGWLGTPGLDSFLLPPATLQLVLGTLLRSGLAGVQALPATGRRPRRPAARPLTAGGRSEREVHERKLLDAALQVFTAAGYDDARLDDIAAAGGTTASALFTYWSGKQALFLRLHEEVTGRIAMPILEAIAAESTPRARLRAAAAANIRVHYEQPDFQAVLLPVPSLPPEAELESVGWNATIAQVGLVPGLERAGPVLPVVTAIGLTVLRLAVLTMHRYAIHPAIVTAVASDYLDAGITALTAELGLDFA